MVKMMMVMMMNTNHFLPTIPSLPYVYDQQP